MKWASTLRILLSMFLAVSAFFCPSSAQQLAKRLILKDGSYQLATKWVVQGERVRYFSAERAEWEEVPNSMVDWAATSKYEKERAEGLPTPEALNLDKELADQRAAEEAQRPLVAPGLRLPDDGGVLLLDEFQNQPQLVPLEGKVVHVRQKGEVDCMNGVCSDPNVKDKVEIAGPHADVQAHAAVPVLYMKLDSVRLGDASDAASLKDFSNRFQIIRALVKKDRRIVGAIRVSYYGLAQPEEQKSVPATIEPMAEGWLKITPARPLAPGEYGLVELMNGKGEINLNVQAVYLPNNIWDFGVNPSAPANAMAVKPASSPSPASGDAEPKEQPQP